MKTIGRYQVMKELGRGGMGAVLLGYDPKLRRHVAIKQVLPESVDGDMGQWLENRLYREAEAAGKLRHPAIVSIYDIVEEGGGAYIIMEYVAGRTLDKVIAPGKAADPAFLLKVLRQSAAALDHAHERNIVHRDIKPGNVMIDESGAVRITDFGIAKILDARSQSTPGMIIGTYEYMSPEQISGKTVDGRTDQFSLAVMAWRLLTGRRVFDTDSIRTLTLKVLTEPPPPASRVNPAIPRAVDAVLARAMAKAPGDRYPSCTAFVAGSRRRWPPRPPWSSR